MKLSDFKNLDRKWLLVNGAIRTDRGECPLCALANEKHGKMLLLDWPYAAQALGLSLDEGELIACSADRTDGKYRAELMELIDGQVPATTKISTEEMACA